MEEENANSPLQNVSDMPETPPPESPTEEETAPSESAELSNEEEEPKTEAPVADAEMTTSSTEEEKEEQDDEEENLDEEEALPAAESDEKDVQSPSTPAETPKTDINEDSKDTNDIESDSNSIKRPIESPSSVTNSESSVRPNKRKRKGTPARHIQSESNNRVTDVKSPGEGDGEKDSDMDKANNRKLLEDFERKSEVGLSRPVSQNGEPESAATRPASRPVQRSSREKYGPPRLDLFGPPQHYLDLFGPPVREPTDNCSVVIRGIGEEEIYCGPGDKDPGDVLIPVRSNSHF